MGFRFTSPALRNEDRLLKECPVGYVLREMPFAYDAINAHVCAENGALNPVESPRWLQQAIGVISSEKNRLFELKQSRNKSKSDSDYGKRVREGR